MGHIYLTIHTEIHKFTHTHIHLSILEFSLNLYVAVSKLQVAIRASVWFVGPIGPSRSNLVSVCTINNEDLFFLLHFRFKMHIILFLDRLRRDA